MQILERKYGDIVILDIIGEIRLGDEPEVSLSKKVKSLLKQGSRDFLLNLAQVDFIDSNGIGEIVAGFASIKHKDGIMKLCNVSDKVLLILKYTHLTNLIEVLENEEAALQSYD